MFRSCWFVVIAGLATAGVGGCSSIAGPRWFDPGTAPAQRYWAQIHDPYPEEGSGPEIVGGRPRQYDKGLPEIDRARFYVPGRP